MPEYPDITVYIERLRAFVQGQILESIRIISPFLLRTAEPPIHTIEDHKVHDFERLGKRIVFVFSQDRYLILHLMVAGRLRWREKGCKIPKKIGMAAFDFSGGSLLLTEAGSKKRASLHLVEGRHRLLSFDPGGLEVFEASSEEFHQRLVSENHTLKRALTDPRLFSGIGNAYSDEILHRARLSPVCLTQKKTGDEIGRLYKAT